MDIKDIKSSLSILQVLAEYHLKPDPNNRLCCPFHDDKTPSLQIYPKTNTWTCFSSNCSAGSGDTIEMIQKMEKCTKHEALTKAAELCGEVNQNNQQERESSKDGMTSVSTLNETPALSLAEVFAKLRQSLHRSKNALTYLEERNIDASLEIGYNHYQTEYKQLQNCMPPTRN